ncbi:MAG: hypothetical protein V2I36_14390 [Desulfopila sp.]|jgi:hypothetical protein|nr:hypothetical protein [Desulfopila sp.]
MDPISQHLILVSAPDLESACDQVEDFFDNTPLVRYDRIEIKRDECCSGEESAFHHAIENGLETNSATLHKFIAEFEKTGFHSIKDLHTVECGYPSKLLHIITHFLDGFIGIDSAFYNLTDSSHRLPEETRRHIRETPGHYWAIQLDGYSETPDRVSLVQA